MSSVLYCVWCNENVVWRGGSGGFVGFDGGLLFKREEIVRMFCDGVGNVIDVGDVVGVEFVIFDMLVMRFCIMVIMVWW